MHVVFQLLAEYGGQVGEAADVGHLVLRGSQADTGLLFHRNIALDVLGVDVLDTHSYVGLA